MRFRDRVHGTLIIQLNSDEFLFLVFLLVLRCHSSCMTITKEYYAAETKFLMVKKIVFPLTKSEFGDLGSLNLRVV